MAITASSTMTAMRCTCNGSRTNVMICIGSPARAVRSIVSRTKCVRGWSSQVLNATTLRMTNARLSASRRTTMVVEAAAVADRSVALVLLAGGVGKRMGAAIPKQYLPLRGKPIAVYSLETMARMAQFGEIVVVCGEDYREVFESADCPLPIKFALPGAERQDSVFNGLAEVSEGAALVCVHDSARPLVTVNEIEAVLADAAEVGAAVLGVQCKATVKEATSDGMVIKTLDRSKLWEMHTPQVIRPQLLRDGFALVTAEGLEVTDDVSIVEHLGEPVRITKGSYENLKVTTPEDLLIADRLLDERAQAAVASSY